MLALLSLKHETPPDCLTGTFESMVKTSSMTDPRLRSLIIIAHHPRDSNLHDPRKYAVLEAKVPKGILDLCVSDPAFEKVWIRKLAIYAKSYLEQDLRRKFGKVRCFTCRATATHAAATNEYYAAQRLLVISDVELVCDNEHCKHVAKQNKAREIDEFNKFYAA